MIKQAIIGASFVLASLGTGLVSSDSEAKVILNFDETKIEYVKLREVNCDELVHLAKKKVFVKGKPGGTIITHNPQNCLYVKNTFYDFFEAVGHYTRTKDGRCVVWSCEGVLSLGDHG